MAFRHRFLIDECLSPRLAEAAAGLAEVVHVNFRGLAGQPDGAIARWCVEHDHVLVTNNGGDFRRHYAGVGLHPGLVILLPSVERDRQCRLFRTALPAIVTRPDLVNTLVEISLEGTLTIIDWPKS